MRALDTRSLAGRPSAFQLIFNTVPAPGAPARGSCPAFHRLPGHRSGFPARRHLRGRELPAGCRLLHALPPLDGYCCSAARAIHDTVLTICRRIHIMTAPIRIGFALTGCSAPLRARDGCHPDACAAGLRVTRRSLSFHAAQLDTRFGRRRHVARQFFVPDRPPADRYHPGRGADRPQRPVRQYWSWRPARATRFCAARATACNDTPVVMAVKALSAQGDKPVVRHPPTTGLQRSQIRAAQPPLLLLCPFCQDAPRNAKPRSLVADMERIPIPSRLRRRGANSSLCCSVHLRGKRKTIRNGWSFSLSAVKAQLRKQIHKLQRRQSPRPHPCCPLWYPHARWPAQGSRS